MILISKTSFLASLLCLCLTTVNGQTRSASGNFAGLRYMEIPLGDIQPEGWLRDQLETMAAHSTGHMDEIYGKVRDDNGWLGGQGDDWEETPYWLDGAVPLAYQLMDKKLIRKVKKYIDWNLDHQRQSGYFGPVTDWERESGNEITVENCEKGGDWWPKMVMLKVIQQYYTATSDQRVIPFMTNYFRYQQQTLDSCPIGNWTQWSAARGVENIKMVQWLYTQTGDDWLLDLAEKILSQSYQWSEMLGSRDWVINAAVHPDGRQWMERHGVNVGMALKAPAENYLRTGDSTFLVALKTGFTDLMTLHGLPNGIFSADEDLHGNAPIQGTELCAIVETMYSLEDIIAITGDPFYMDALERTTFNALPSQTTDDYTKKQYFQLANQIEIQRGVYAFTLPFDRKMNNVLGAKSGYTCCYVNMHQGWTKFTQHLWYGIPDGGLAALEYSPNILRTVVNDEEVTIHENTNYPFSEEISFSLETKKPVSFPFQLRIPSWCSDPELTVNGQPVSLSKGQTLVTVSREWKQGDTLTLTLPMEVRATTWAENSKSIERGPLVYGLKMHELWGKGVEEKEGEYLTVSSDSPWNFGLLKQEVADPATEIEVKQLGMSEKFAWNLENVPVELHLKARRIPGWKALNGLAYLPVSGRDGKYKGEVSEEIETIQLVPVGFTKLRIMAFPVVE